MISSCRRLTSRPKTVSESQVLNPFRDASFRQGRSGHRGRCKWRPVCAMAGAKAPTRGSWSRAAKTNDAGRSGAPFCSATRASRWPCSGSPERSRFAACTTSKRCCRRFSPRPISRANQTAVLNRIFRSMRSCWFSRRNLTSSCGCRTSFWPRPDLGNRRWNSLCCRPR